MMSRLIVKGIIRSYSMRQRRISADVKSPLVSYEVTTQIRNTGNSKLRN